MLRHVENEDQHTERVVSTDQNKGILEESRKELERDGKNKS